MAIVIKMPKLSDTMTEGTLGKWRKSVGDHVKVGDVIADVETDKATMEMVANDEGILGRIWCPEGGKALLGAALAILVEEGEEAPVDAPVMVEKNTTATPSGPTGPKPTQASRGGRSHGTSDRIKASPLAKKVADERGVDLRDVEGTGPGGRVVKADIVAAANHGARGSSGGGAPAPQAIRPVAGPDDTRTPLSGMRTIIASRLLASKQQIPHFYLNIEVDAAPIMALRAEVNLGSEKAGGNKYTVNDFILKAVAGAAAQVPAVNASFDGDSIVQFASVNLSVAIAVEEGLVTPVIKAANKKSLLELSLAVKDLAVRAKGKKLTPDEFAGGTITVSNLGAYGIDNFDAIINPPQAAILSVGAAKKVAVVNAAGQIVPGDRMWVGMSCDHRVVDGAVAAQYLAALKRLLENPALMLV